MLTLMARLALTLIVACDPQAIWDLGQVHRSALREVGLDTGFPVGYQPGPHPHAGGGLETGSRPRTRIVLTSAPSCLLCLWQLGVLDAIVEVVEKGGRQGAPWISK